MAYVMHPWLLVAGLLAVSLPVLIHLLNRRRFRIVDWAAMDFLLEADKESRRRIRLQHWLLLLLRSLAVALVGLLLARPFLPSGFTGRLAPTAPFERIIVLDDSLSMQARWSNSSAWDAAKNSAIDLIRRLAAQQGGKDTLTLLVTSQIAQPLIANTPLTDARLDELQSRLEELNCSEGAIGLPAALHELIESLRSQVPGVNRAIYVFTDMRQPDWQGSQTAASAANGTRESLEKLEELVQGCFLIDAADEHDSNLTIERVQSDLPIVSDVRTAFDVTVRNRGSAAAKNIDIKIFVDGGLPASETIQRLAAGESSTVRFFVSFTCEPTSGGKDDRAQRVAPRRVRVELKPENIAGDLLAQDSKFYFPAHVHCGIQTLLVDGDPGTQSAKAESFFLRRALAPLGSTKSGVLCEVVSEDDISSLMLADYDVVFLLNCSRLGSPTNDNLNRLQHWVAAGGSLALMPGDQTDAQWFNAHLWQNGQGLSPLKLISPTPDEGQQSWVGLQFVENNDLLPRLAVDSAFVENVKIFRHWRADVDDQNTAHAGRVVARFDDETGSPAIVEKNWGLGRVVALALPADADWHNWPSNPSYVLMFQDLVHALARDRSGTSFVQVGEAIRQSADLAKYEMDAVFEGPTGANVKVHAAAPANSQTESPHWEFMQPVVKELGFYTLKLSRHSGGYEESLFAANADPQEGDLRRADITALKRALAKSNVRLMSTAEIPSLTDSHARSELWRYFAWLLVAVLITEQVLGWFFGRERT